MRIQQLLVQHDTIDAHSNHFFHSLAMKILAAVLTFSACNSFALAWLLPKITRHALPWRFVFIMFALFKLSVSYVLLFNTIDVY